MRWILENPSPLGLLRNSFDQVAFGELDDGRVTCVIPNVMEMMHRHRNFDRLRQNWFDRRREMIQPVQTIGRDIEEAAGRMFGELTVGLGVYMYRPHPTQPHEIIVGAPYVSVYGDRDPELHDHDSPDLLNFSAIQFNIATGLFDVAEISYDNPYGHCHMRAL